jgi:hypothetical protein
MLSARDRPVRLRNYVAPALVPAASRLIGTLAGVL